MKIVPHSTFLMRSLCIGGLLACVPAIADDIDIFTGSSAGTAGNPNVLFVLDNTPNWARQSQQWPGGVQQGQSEANAIKTVIQSLGSNVNIGLMEFVTGGNSNDNGGFVRQAIGPMSDANKTSLSTKLTTIYNGINDPNEKTNGSRPYGNLMYDVYNYYAGTNSYSPGGVVSSIADSAGYTSNYTTFKSPLSTDNICGKNFIIFIGNPRSSGPMADSSANLSALGALGGNTSQLNLPTITTGTVATPITLGNTSSCYSSTATAQNACGYGAVTNESFSACFVNTATEVAFQSQCSGYTQGCSIGDPGTFTPASCPSGTATYKVVKSVFTPAKTTTTSTTGTPIVTTSATNACYTSSSAASSTDHGTLTCPSSSTVVNGNTTTTTTYSCTYSVSSTAASSCTGTNLVDNTGVSAYYSSASSSAVSASDHGGLTCPSGYSCTYSAGSSPVTTDTQTSSNVTGYLSSAPSGSAAGTAAGLTCPSGYSCSYNVQLNSTSPSIADASADSNSCYTLIGGSSVGTGSGQWNSATTTDFGSLTCPTGYSCSYSATTESSSHGCGSSTRQAFITRTATPLSTYKVTQTASRYKFQITQTAVPPGTSKFTVTQTATPTITTTTTTAASTATTDLGYTSLCYSSPPTSDTGDFSSQCNTGDSNVTCTYGNGPAVTTTSSCPSGTSQYKILGNNTTSALTEDGTSYLDTATYNADEWARFMYQNGIPLAGSSVKPSVITYTIDVYNKQQNAQQTSLLKSMAKNGGGKYFSAKSEAEITSALQQIMVEIQAVNTTFASTSLPVNATNRTQNENQVFIGMFRPDAGAKPRWFGNLKRFQLISSAGDVALGDVNGTPAVNTITGFLSECAISYWTTDSGTYWQNVTDGTSPSPQLLDSTAVQGKCPGYQQYSDLPDGPLVEKGAVAEVLRNGNNPSGSTTSTVDKRNIYTASGTTITAFNTSSSGLSDSLVNFMLGMDVNNEKATGATTTTRPSIHGDVIHSRPLPVNYGSQGIVVYYGSNDGTYRAVDATTGKEKWAFIAPEFFSRLSRLMTDTPLVALQPNPVSGSTAKDYFFDGSTGLFQDGSNSKVWLFPTMRRGGRMVYGFNVTNPDSPSILWKLGCPNLTDDTGCTSPDMADTDLKKIGQTWSSPNVAFLKNYSTTTPVVIFGGGYDSCEDANTTTPSCSGGKGHAIYVLRADTGQKLAVFNTIRSVVADVSYVDVDGDGNPDYAYAADTGGNIYRIDLRDASPDNWKIYTVAYTSASNGRKFLFAPAVLAVSGKVYVAIGSGDREHPLQSQYPYSNVVNRFYVYLDDPSTTTSTDLDTLLDYTANTNCDTQAVLPGSGLKGWYMNLNQYGPGEQTVTSALITSGMVTFSTNRPISSSNSCTTALGEARGYWVNLLNRSGAIGSSGTCGGTTSNTFVGGGLPPSPVLATSVPINNRATTVVIGAVQRSGSGASVSISPQQVKPVINSKRKKVYSYTKTDN